METVGDSIKGYKVILLKHSSTSKACHYIYVKEHSVREKSKEKPVDRTIFLLSIPPYCTEESLITAFSCCGKISAVYLQAKPTSTAPAKNESMYFPVVEVIKGFKVGYIVFESPLGVQNVLNLDSGNPLVLSTDERPLVTGFKKYCQEYNQSILDPKNLQAEIDSFMVKYDKKEDERLQKEKEDGEPDDEGWVTVTRKGRNPGFARKESVEKRILGKEKKRTAKKQLLNFYRFQIKESKMNNLISLREKFEEDKKKIAVLKQTRKFKPF
uniref:RRM domain-containing protein n=1 Tax=Clastoptera arizonana TaxID=38151 RepID=A0A1B6D7Q1_9HEMI